MLRVTFVSVGQGDCTVIEFPGSQVWVVDGGGLSGRASTSASASSRRSSGAARSCASTGWC
ncbi:MAG: hypothetical protein U0802_17590 [Candidatus Binatia bacterium]